MNWQEVCANPNLKNLPFKIELNEYGQVVMSPMKVFHSLLQGKIEKLLSRCANSGEAFPECAIHTSKGTKVADVVWVSDERLQQIKHEAECSIAPEICIEVLSDSNTEKEMLEKRQLYFQQQAKEFWLCDQQGNVRFFNPQTELLHSELMRQFPKHIDV
ncbi:Uma2 family endonuclease [Methylovulum psychrotolerans]|uniref:Uma2 family endonuclease n=1 Tax=Methylovulum psychrotolerans TaxID=1704499 RepID=UPI001BFF4669|nr:Uma2 family endonuclease [Methylovulum psychrotolerans]MBT9098720.1 Uma2 family endonuclease [Methylovulum psychrotolerans]